jgi:hypothetical protein
LDELEQRDVPAGIAVYQNDFQGQSVGGPEFSVRAASSAAVTPVISTTPVGNRQFLGQFGNATATLSLGNLPAHDAVTISFDVYVINSWDGSDVLKKWGPDGWSFAVDGQSQLSTTFSNQPLPSPGAANNVQTFGGQGAPAGSYPAFTGAAEVNTLGYKFYRGSYQRLESMDSVYRFTYTVPHTDDTVRFDFRGFGLQGLSDESWGLDNVRVMANQVPVVSVSGTGDAAEKGAAGSFTLTRTGDLSRPLTVNLSAGGSATSGADYVALPATATFAEGSATATVTVTPKSDNEFEDADYTNVAVDPETVVLTVASGTGYAVGGSPATVSITDDAPVVTTVVSSNPNSQTGELGQIIVTRSGGDVTKPLTAWVEVSGELELDGESVTPMMAATVEFGANVSSVTIDALLNAAGGDNVPSVLLNGAAAQPLRADQITQLRNAINPNPFTASTFPTVVKNLPDPLTYEEYRLLSQIARFSDAQATITFGGIARGRDAVKAASDKLAASGKRIDWRTLPVISSAAAAAFGAPLAASWPLAADGWAVVEPKVTGWIKDFDSNDGQVRNAARSNLGSLIFRSTERGDLFRSALIVGKLQVALDNATVATDVALIEDLLRQANSELLLRAYRQMKAEAAAAVLSGLGGNP